MVLAVAALLFQFPFASPPATSSLRPADPTAAASSVGLPTIASYATKAPALAPATTAGRSGTDLAGPLPGTTGSSTANLQVPPPPAFRPPQEAPVTHRRWWILLVASEHGAAGFDAWSTRRALLHGRVEADPLMQPFAGSSAIYGAIQIAPFGLDYLARRLRRSSRWTRHVWWVPQSVATATFLFSGSYNVAHTN